MGSSVLLPTPGQPTEGPDPSFRTAAIPNLVTFGFVGVAPPSSLYVQRDDQLAFEGQTLLAAGTESVTITARLLLSIAPVPGQPGNEPLPAPSVPAQGNYIITIQRTIANLPTASPQIITIPLAEGYLLSLSCTCVNALARGATFVRAWINRTTATVATPNSTNMLLADYVTQAANVGWPLARVLYPTEGPGNIRTVSITNPAAGADWTAFVPSNARWRVQNWNAQLAIANAGTPRIIRSIVQDTLVNIYWEGQPNQAAAINTTVQVSAASGQFTSAVDTALINLALPSPCFVPSAGAVRVLTTNINAGDQWSAIRLEVEEWIDLQ